MSSKTSATISSMPIPIISRAAIWFASAASAGRRISELKLDNGRSLEAGKSYRVAGWASVNEQSGAPVWDVLAKHLRSPKTPDRHGAGVTLKGVDDNPGLAGQG